MKQKRVVIICLDEEYIESLEYRMAEAFGRDNNVEFITDYEYFREFIAKPQDMDILLIQAGLYQEAVSRQNLKEVYLLTENEENAGQENSSLKCIYKYSSIRRMMDIIDKHYLAGKGAEEQENTKLISVYSVNGGSGKTTASLGIASALAEDGFKVLYMSIECLQDYRLLLEQEDTLPGEIGFRYAVEGIDILPELLSLTEKNGFEYFPPFSKPLTAYQVTPEILLEQALALCEKKQFDYLVLELSQEINQKKMEVLQKSARVVLVTRQDSHSVAKLQLFTEELADLSAQCVLVCNRYQSEKEDALKNSRVAARYVISEYIPEEESAMSLEIIRQKNVFKRTAVAIR